MKVKTFFSFAASVLVLTLLIGIVSAISVSNSPSVITLTPSDSSETLTISSGDLFNITDYNHSLIINGATVNINLTSSATNVTSATFSISTDFPTDFGFVADSGTLNIVIVNSSNSSISFSDTVSIELENLEFCKSIPNNAALDVVIDSVNTVDGFGDDESYWYPLDEVEVDVDIENNGDWDVQNIEITACLYDESSEKCVMDEDDMDISDDKFDLDSGDDTSITLSFQVDADNLKTGNTGYKLFVKAVGEIDDRDAPDAVDNTDSCSSDLENIEIRTDEQFVIISNIEFPEELTCGQQFELSADVWNIGDEDMDDDEVFVVVYNKALGIDEVIEFNSGIDALDKETFSISLTIPEGAEEKAYGIELIVYDDNDLSDKDIYQNSEDDEAQFVEVLQVTGCGSTSNVIASPRLVSGGEAGQPLEVAVTITNSGNSNAVYVISAEDYSSWANSASISNPIATLSKGDSTEITITFDVKDDVDGDQNFNIKVIQGSDTILTQPVQVSITKSESALSKVFGENWYLWLIGLLNLVLVIVIIIVAIRVARS